MSLSDRAEIKKKDYYEINGASWNKNKVIMSLSDPAQIKQEY